MSSKRSVSTADILSNNSDRPISPSLRSLSPIDNGDQSGLDETFIIDDEDNHEVAQELASAKQSQGQKYIPSAIIATTASAMVQQVKLNSSGEDYALKKMIIRSDQGFPVQIMREITIQKDLNHPNIVKIIDVMVDRSGNKYDISIIQELMSMDLHTYLTENHMKTKDRLNVIKSILFAVSYFHSLGVVHHDLKPENILISVEGIVKVGDFGLARYQRKEGTISDPNIGTMPYFSPEKLIQRTDLTNAVDIWSIGCIYIDMLTFPKRIFQKDSYYEQLLLIFDLLGFPDKDFYTGGIYEHIDIHSSPKGLHSLFISNEVDEREIDIIQYMLTIYPEKRPSAKEVLEKIEELFHS